MPLFPKLIDITFTCLSAWPRVSSVYELALHVLKSIKEFDMGRKFVAPKANKKWACTGRRKETEKENEGYIGREEQRKSSHNMPSCTTRSNLIYKFNTY
jgi:hypothetical protein